MALSVYEKTGPWEASRKIATSRTKSPGQQKAEEVKRMKTERSEQ